MSSTPRHDNDQNDQHLDALVGLLPAAPPMLGGVLAGEARQLRARS
jgi:hypothetical protein